MELIKSIDNLALSSLYENLFGEQQSTLPLEISALLQHLNKALKSRSLNRNFYHPGLIVRSLRFHYFKPTINSFLYVCDSKNWGHIFIFDIGI